MFKVTTNELVMVPWDFSEMSQAALAQAAQMVDDVRRLEVVHVTPYPAAVEPSVVWGAFSEPEIITNLEKGFREQMSGELADVKFTAVFGDPGSQIAELAQSHGAGLIVISSHGRKGITRVLLGSVAERVVRLAPCPVLVLRADGALGES